MSSITLPPAHPSNVRWVGLLNARSRNILIDGWRFVIRAPIRLKKSDWRYAQPVPRDVLPQLLGMRTDIEPQPDADGNTPSSRLINVPLFAELPAPPDWRQKISDSKVNDWIRHLGGKAQSLATGPAVDTAALAAAARAEVEAEQANRWIDAAKAGAITRDQAAALVDAGLAPPIILDEIGGDDGTAEARAVVGQKRDYLLKTIETVESLSVLADIEKAEAARPGGSRKYVDAAIAVRRAELGADVVNPDDDDAADDGDDTDDEVDPLQP